MIWSAIADRVLAGKRLSRPEALAVLNAADEETLALLDGAFRVRRAAFGMSVSLHVIRNARSGACTEDCAYCSQSASADTPITEYPMQTPDEIVAGARDARALNALRYCVVTSGRGPDESDLDAVCAAVRRIKAEIPIQVCTSLGMLTVDQARRLKAAGVNRYNHNLETSERYYPSICSAHAFRDRVATAQAAKAAGLELCSGGLIGMGETLEDRVDLAFALRDVQPDSIPLNFLDPRPGTALEGRPRLGALEALRTLAMFRFAHPQSELRVAGGREACLGPLQPLSLYAANSMFTNGYLTTGGQGHEADMAMIRAAGFHVTEITCD